MLEIVPVLAVPAKPGVLHQHTVDIAYAAFAHGSKLGIPVIAEIFMPFSSDGLFPEGTLDDEE